jgi:hypothetical protein
MKSLEEIYELWRAACARRHLGLQNAHIKAARQLTASGKSEFWSWLTESLHDEQRKWFVAAFFDSYPVPRRLLNEMIRAGVYERNPSSNKLFIEPCVSSFGSEPVCTELLTYLEHGSNVEKAGAASAFYWAASHTNPPTEELRQRIREQMLSEFVNNPDVELRRRVIPMLVLNEERYPTHVRPLVMQAIAIARLHSDEYIRHRVEIQLGARGPFLPIPR